MPKTIDLPYTGWSAVITERDWISERRSREVSRAMVDAQAVTSKLTKLGFSDADPETYGIFSSLDDQEKNNLTAFQSVLITAFVEKITMDTSTISAPIDIETADNLPQFIFDALAAACLEEWTPKEDAILDPKADTGASPS